MIIVEIHREIFNSQTLKSFWARIYPYISESMGAYLKTK
jgi:hypothetical protein